MPAGSNRSRSGVSRLGLLLLGLGIAGLAVVVGLGSKVEAAREGDSKEANSSERSEPGLEPSRSALTLEASRASALEPEASDPELSAQGFLAAYEGGEAILEHFASRGKSLKGWPAPPPLEAAKPILLERLLMTPEELQAQVQARIQWSDDWTEQQLLGHLRLSPEDLAPGVGLETAMEVAWPFNEELRAKAERYYADVNIALATEFNLSARFSPYTTSTLEPSDDLPGGAFYAKSVTAELWACKLRLARDHYPELLQAKRELAALAAARDAMLVQHLRGS